MATSSTGDRKCEQQRLHKRVEGVQTTTAAAGGRCAQRSLRTAIATGGATSCCRTVFFHLVAVARRCGGVALLRATWRRPVLVPPNGYCRSGLAVHALTPECPTALSTARPCGWTARGSIDATREREGGRRAAAVTAATTELRINLQQPDKEL